MRDIDVYGYIGSAKMADSDVTAKDFIDQLRKADGDDVTVHINSAGGNLFEANAMAEALRSYKGKSTASIEGLAASAASYFALTADEVVMNPYALFMVHNPSGAAFGTADELRSQASVLDKSRETIVAQYARKTGMDKGEIGRLMDEETWFSADEALEKGFVDRLTDAEPIEMRATPEQVASFKNFPRASAEAPAGNARPTITADDKAGVPGPGADAGETGAVSEVVCLHGLFLTRPKE